MALSSNASTKVPTRFMQRNHLEDLIIRGDRPGETRRLIGYSKNEDTSLLSIFEPKSLQEAKTKIG